MTMLRSGVIETTSEFGAGGRRSEHPPPDEIRDEGGREDSDHPERDRPPVLANELNRPVAVPDGQQALEEISAAAANRDRGRELADADPCDAGHQDENLERRRRR